MMELYKHHKEEDSPAIEGVWRQFKILRKPVFIYFPWRKYNKNAKPSSMIEYIGAHNEIFWLNHFNEEYGS